MNTFEHEFPKSDTTFLIMIQNVFAPLVGQNMETAILLQDNVPARLDWLAKIVLIVQLVLLVIIVIVALQATIIMGILIAENLVTKVSSNAPLFYQFQVRFANLITIDWFSS